MVQVAKCTPVIVIIYGVLARLYCRTNAVSEAHERRLMVLGSGLSVFDYSRPPDASAACYTKSPHRLECI